MFPLVEVIALMIPDPSLPRNLPMTLRTSPPASPPQRHKEILVDLGLACLARGEWGMISAITCLVQSGGLAHE
jgi:hypothetical protein